MIDLNDRSNFSVDPAVQLLRRPVTHEGASQDCLGDGHATIQYLCTMLKLLLKLLLITNTILYIVGKMVSTCMEANHHSVLPRLISM